MSIETRIAELRKLPVGWDCGQGVPTSEAVAHAALEISSVILLAEVGMTVETTPQTNGGIWLTLAFESDSPANQNFLNISVNPNLTVDVRHERGFGADYDLISEQNNVDKMLITSQIEQIASDIRQKTGKTTTKQP